MITRELKTQWIDALRSGRYQQGRGYFYRYGQSWSSGCALGLLVYLTMQGCSAVTLRRIDWDTYAHDLLGTDAEAAVIAMNDGMQKSFSEIADWLEEYLPVSNPQPMDVKEWLTKHGVLRSPEFKQQAAICTAAIEELA